MTIERAITMLVLLLILIVVIVVIFRVLDNETASGLLEQVRAAGPRGGLGV